ncbi:MAG TPA: trigger factor [Acidobacteriota bacterium]|nr:trigger factor [Acidobacteriota bacterium]
MDVQATITKEDEWTRTVQVTVPATEVDAAFEAVTKQYRQKSNIPGFRPGKAPLKMVNERFADAIRQDVIEEIIPAALRAALGQLALDPLGAPTLDNLSKVKPGSDMSFEAAVEVRPDFEITGYKGLELTKQIYEVGDEDVDRAVDSLRDEKATTTEVTRPAREGDVVVCNLQKIYDRLNRVKQSQFDGIRIELREDRTRPEFLKGLVGMGVGEGKEIEVNYPPEETDPDLAGNTLLYRVWMKSVSQKTLPPADDDFARALTDGKTETLTKLRDILREDLKRRAEQAAQRDLRAQVRKAIVDANPIPVPTTFLNRYLEDIANRLKAQNPSVTPEAVRAQFEPLASEQFRWDLALYEIARVENVTVTDAEVAAIVKGWPEGAPEKPDAQRIHSSLLESRVYEAIIATAEVREVPYTPRRRIITPGE